MNLESVLIAIENVEQSIASLRELLSREQAERDAFTSFLYRSRKDYRVILDHEGEAGLRRERFVVSNYKDARRFGFNGGEGAWEHLLGISTPEPGDGESAFEVEEFPESGKFLVPWQIRQAA